MAHDRLGRPLVPFYPQATVYGSRDWWDKNFRIEQPDVGEVINASHAWNNGSPPVLPPRPRTVGSPQCIDGGESISSGLAKDSPERYLSWPVACFVLQPVDAWGQWSDVYTCRVQRFWTDRMKQLNDGDLPGMRTALADAFPGATIIVHSGGALYPPYVTVVHAEYSVVMIAPTQNAEQALAQVMQGRRRPADVGGFGSIPIWQQQAARVLAGLTADGGNPTTPLLCVGYSYGGAAAMLAAAMCRLERPQRTIHYLTFGAPRPGDARLQELLELPTRGLSLINRGDLIGSIPPNLPSLIPAQVVLGMLLTNYAAWIQPREAWILEADGTARVNEQVMINTPDLVELLEHVFTTGSFFGYPAHNIATYQVRLRLRCAAPLVPCAFIVQENGDDITLEDQSGALELDDGVECCHIEGEGCSGAVLLEDGGGICLEDCCCCIKIVNELAEPVLLEDGSGWFCAEKCECSSFVSTETLLELALEDGSGFVCTEQQCICDHVLDELGGDVRLEDGSGVICLEST